MSRTTALSSVDRLAAMEGRILQLERRNRILARWTKLSAVGLVFLGLFSLVPIERPTSAKSTDLVDEIRARRIHVENPGDEAGIVLSVSEQGDPCIGLFGKEGVPRALLCQTQDGSSNLVLAGGAGEDRVKVVVSKEGIPAVFLFDQEGRNRLMMGVDQQGGPLLGLFDESRRPYWSPPAPQSASRGAKGRSGE